MWHRILRRIVESIFTVLMAVLVTFLLFQYLGDPVQVLLGEGASDEAARSIRAKAGLNDAAPVRFFRFAERTLKGDLGVSYRSGLPVLELLKDRLPATLELVLCACLITVLASVPLAIYSAARKGGLGDTLVQVFSLGAASMPTFLTGMLLIYFFAVHFPIFPAAGRGEVRQWGWWSTGFGTSSGMLALVLPSVTLASFQTALFIRLIRAEMAGALASDYVLCARARGLSRRSVLLRHALRNALLPVVTVAGTQFGMLLFFSIVTETVFAWPGTGALFMDAIRNADLPVISAYLLLAAVSFALISLAVDLLYLAVDPRLRRPARAS